MVYYNPSTQHWVLESAYYSAHTGWNYRQYDAGAGYAGGVEYPSHLGSYPRVWVAQQKHASYFTQDNCTGAEFLGVSDTCNEDDASAREDWSSSWNIGSQLHPYLNAVMSRDPSCTLYVGVNSSAQSCNYQVMRPSGQGPEPE